MTTVSRGRILRRPPLGYLVATATLGLVVALVLPAARQAPRHIAARMAARRPAWGWERLSVPDDAILFADFPGGGEEKELFLIAPDGSGREAITASPRRPESQPAWSPSRREVAYTAPLYRDPQLGEVWGIEVLDLATRLTRTLTAGPLDVAPDWSPDGRWIAFSSIFGYGMASQGSSISVVASDGSELQPLVELSGRALLQSPVWSPDGRRIAFSVSYANGGELYALEMATRRVERLFGHPGMDDIDPAWSPDGRTLAFASGFYHAAARQARHDIWLLDLSTGRAGTIASHADYDLGDPAWSPDGRALVFYAEVKPPPSGRWELYVVGVTGGAPQRLLTTGVEPDWDSGLPWPTGTATSGLPTPTAPAESSPTGPATPTPPSPPTLPPLPTLPAFPTLVPGEPTATWGTPPTFAAATNTATATIAPSATEPEVTTTAAPLGLACFLPYAAHGHALSEATATPPTCLHREVEPNDTLAEADRQADLCDCVPARSALGPQDPEDLFGLTIRQPLPIEAHLWAAEDETVDYELALYRKGNFDPVARGEAAPEGGRNRSLRASLAPGRYYVRVRPEGGAGGSGREFTVVWCSLD